MKRIPRLLSLAAGALALLGRPASAQERLPLWTQVRVAMPRGEIVEGRLIGGDASSITVQTERADTVTVQRDRIVLLAASFARRPDQLASARILAGAIGAALAGALSVSCNLDGGCRPHRGALVGGAALGALGGSLIMEARAPASLSWRAVPSSIEVSNRSAGIGAPETCRRWPTLQADLGFSGAGSRASRLSATISCYRGMSFGAEVGWPRDLSWQTRSYGNMTGDYYYPSYFYRENNRTHDAAFVGMFTEHAFRGALNPRLLASVGTYRRSDKVLTVSRAPTGIGAPAETRSEQSVESTHTGFGVGFGVSMPTTSYLSLGVEGRSHWLFGNGAGSINTIAATARIRP